MGPDRQESSVKEDVQVDAYLYVPTELIVSMHHLLLLRDGKSYNKTLPAAYFICRIDGVGNPGIPVPDLQRNS